MCATGQQFYVQKHTTTIGSDRFKSDNSQPFNLLGTRSGKSPNGTDVSGVGVAVDGRLANRRQKETLPQTRPAQRLAVSEASVVIAMGCRLIFRWRLKTARPLFISSLFQQVFE